MTSEFSVKVQNIVGPVLASHGYVLDDIDDHLDEGCRRGHVVYYRSPDSKVQIYQSSREGEVNCMIAPPDASNKFGLRAAKWQFLTRFVKHPDLSAADSIARARAEFESYSEPLEWVRDNLVKYLDIARAGILDMYGIGEAGSDPTFDRFAEVLQEHPPGRPAIRTFHVVDDGRTGSSAQRDEQIAAQASAMLDPIVQELAVLGPTGWREFSAECSLTVRAGSATCWFASAAGRAEPVTVPGSIVGRVREQRELSAQMSAGPWFRLLLNVTHDGRMQVRYDYGDEPFPPDQLQPAENYRADLLAYPRSGVPIWLAGYMAGASAQGRTPEQAAAAVQTDRGAQRSAVETDDIEPLPETWARWAVLAAVYSGVRSEWGPRIDAGVAWFESDARSGSSLYLLAGHRAVLSGGRWNSPLLAAAYQHQQPLPDLYRGAPEWVNDTVLNRRCENGLLSFCYWWDKGRWWRGGTDTFDELDDPLPPIWTPEECIAAMTALVGPASRAACDDLLSAAMTRTADRELLASVFAGLPDPDLDAAYVRLDLAGVRR